MLFTAGESCVVVKLYFQIAFPHQNSYCGTKMIGIETFLSTL